MFFVNMLLKTFADKRFEVVFDICFSIELRRKVTTGWICHICTSSYVVFSLQKFPGDNVCEGNFHQMFVSVELHKCHSNVKKLFVVVCQWILASIQFVFVGSIPCRCFLLHCSKTKHNFQQWTCRRLQFYNLIVLLIILFEPDPHWPITTMFSMAGKCLRKSYFCLLLL